MANWFTPRVPTQLNSTRGVGTNGYPRKEEWSWTPTLHHTEKWTQSGPYTYM